MCTASPETRPPVPRLCSQEGDTERRPSCFRGAQPGVQRPQTQKEAREGTEGRRQRLGTYGAARCFLCCLSGRVAPSLSPALRPSAPSYLGQVLFSWLQEAVVPLATSCPEGSRGQCKSSEGPSTAAVHSRLLYTRFFLLKSRKKLELGRKLNRTERQGWDRVACWLEN